MTERTASDPDTGTRPERSPRRVRPFLPGLLVAALGVVFLLDNLDVIDSGRILRFWPLILILAGARRLWEARDRGAALWGAVLSGAGGLLLLETLDLVDFDVWDLWPLVLVAIGLRMLAFPGRSAPAPRDGADGVEHCSAFLGSVERRVRSADFRGGSVSAFLGGVHLDLTGADGAGGGGRGGAARLGGDGRRRNPHPRGLDDRSPPDADARRRRGQDTGIGRRGPAARRGGRDLHGRPRDPELSRACAPERP